MPPGAEVLSHRPVRGETPLRVAGSCNPLPAPCALTRRPMRVVTPVMARATLPMFHPGQALTLRRAVARQLIGDEDAGHRGAALEQCAQALRRGLFVAPMLYKNVQDVVGLIHRTPEIVACTINC
jgi:hypothetical protein